MPSKTPEANPALWSSASASYERAVAPHTQHYALQLLDALQVTRGDRLLDVAAGTGSLAVLAAKRGARVVAADFASGMVERLKQHAQRERVDVDARVMDGQRLDLPDGAFDVAASVLGLIFFPDRAQGLRELHRVLRPGGRAGIVAWGAPEKNGAFLFFGEAMRNALPSAQPPPGLPPVFSMSDPKVIERETMEAGFHDVRVRTITHTWTIPSAEAMWSEFLPAGPGAEMLLSGLDHAAKERLRAEIVRLARDRAGGNGPVPIPGEVHIATAKRS